MYWNAEENEVYFTEELEMANNIYGDNELNCSDEPTAVRVDQPIEEIVLPEVEITGDTPAVCQDVDLVLTFRSKRTSLRQTSDSPSTPVTYNIDDGSVSKLSDNTSCLIAFEDHFNKITQDLQKKSEKQEQAQAEQKELLTSIMLLLRPHNPPNTFQATTPYVTPVDGQPSIPSTQANSLVRSNPAGGTSQSAAGHCS